MSLLEEIDADGVGVRGWVGRVANDANIFGGVQRALLGEQLPVAVVADRQDHAVSADEGGEEEGGYRGVEVRHARLVERVAQIILISDHRPFSIISIYLQFTNTVSTLDDRQESGQ